MAFCFTLRVLQNAAALKLLSADAARCVEISSPRSSERGCIEAEASRQRLPPCERALRVLQNAAALKHRDVAFCSGDFGLSPRSSERGCIEANSSTVLARLSFAGSPRSSERGCIEATPVRRRVRCEKRALRVLQNAAALKLRVEVDQVPKLNVLSAFFRTRLH